jgi:CubicO group peptidase (beta-lactamase class C family)
MDSTEGLVDCARQSCVPWWSFTKTVLATAALRLVAQGRLSLDESFDGRPYTLRQLLQHRAGVPDYSGLPSYHAAVQRGDKPWDVGQLLDRVGADRLDFEPGHGWRYSNVGYFFIRRKIEQTTGHDIGSALRHLVFDALGPMSPNDPRRNSKLADWLVAVISRNCAKSQDLEMMHSRWSAYTWKRT